MGGKNRLRLVALVWVALGATLYLLAVRSDPATPAPGSALFSGCIDDGPVAAEPTPVGEGCPDWPEGRRRDVVVDLVGVREWTPDHPLPLDTGERARLELRVDACPDRWGGSGCTLRPCVVTLAVQHDLTGGLVWVDGAWRLRDTTGFGPSSELVPDSWFYLEPGAVRLPRDRLPLSPGDCSLFQRVREVPHGHCEDPPGRVALDWVLEDFRLSTGRGTFSVDQLEAWQSAAAGR